MAGPSKKPRVPSSESSQSDSGSDGEEEIQATFEGRNPCEDDYHGIMQLLKQLFVRCNIDLGKMCEQIISQGEIGSVLKQSINDSDDESDLELTDDNDVFGVTTILDVSDNKDQACFTQLKKYIEAMSKKSKDQTIDAAVSDILHNKKLGFIVNERFVNIPCAVSVHMFTSLLQELKKNQKKDMFKFEYLVMICKLWKLRDNDGLVFVNEEESVFEKNAHYCFEYQVDSQSNADTGSVAEDLPAYRHVLLIKSSMLPLIVKQLLDFTQIQMSNK